MKKPDNPNSLPNQNAIEPNVNESAETTSTPPHTAARKTLISLRLLAFIATTTPLILLAITARLTPAADGLGTHQQLGLPPCSTRVIFGIPCPACGMTTSWAHFVRGQWSKSMQTNPGGFLLAIYSLVFAASSARTSFTGKWPSRRVQNGLTISLVAIGLITLAHWFFRLRLLE